MDFPPFPRNAAEIWDYPGRGERMACTIVHNCTVRQLMAYGKLRIALGEQEFRRTLIDGLDVLSRSTGIKDPAAWLYWYISREVPHV